jgi:spermidine/putrescine transport system permease protein
VRPTALGLYATLLYAFLHLPLVVLGVFSFNSSRLTHWEGFSLVWYQAALGDKALVEATVNSLVIALFATVLSTAIGTLAAYAIWKAKSRWLTMSLSVSLVTPEIVSAVSLLALFQIVFRVLRLQLGMHTVVLAHVSFCLVYVVMVVLARLRTMDGSLEEAAADLGATPWQAFWEVTLPMLRPGVIAAALLAFTTSLDDYVITSLVAGVDSETLPMIIYGMARRGVNPAVNAISTIIVFGLGVLIVISQRLEQKQP